MTKTLVSIFLSVHITMMVTAALPDRSAIGNKILKSLARYQIFFGLDQPWSMFAPNPSATNSYLTATILFKDGSTETWTFPRASRMNSFERFASGERFRKYQQENLTAMEKSELWEDLSSYVGRAVARIEEHGRKRELKEVQFFRHHNVVEPPTKVFIPHGILSSKFESESIFKFKPIEKVQYEVSHSN